MATFGGRQEGRMVGNIWGDKTWKEGGSVEKQDQ